MEVCSLGGCGWRTRVGMRHCLSGEASVSRGLRAGQLEGVWAASWVQPLGSPRPTWPRESCLW